MLLLAGLIGLGFGWLIFGLLYAGLVLAIISFAIGIVTFGLAYAVVMMRGYDRCEHG
jgi:hypothetical protein